MFRSISQVFRLFQDQKLQFFGLLGLIFCTAIFDVIGIASIFPFINALSDPGNIQNDEILSFLYKLFNFTETTTFIFYLGLAVFIILATSLVIKSLTLFFQFRFVSFTEFRLGKKLIEKFLNQPYSWFLDQNSSELGKRILSEVSIVATGAVLPVLNMIVHLTISISIICLLLFINPVATLIVSSILVSSYLIIFSFLNGFIKKIGKLRVKENEKRFKAVNEAFSSSKIMKLMNLEDFFTSSFKQPAQRFAIYNSTVESIAQIPRNLLEAITFGGMIAFTLIMMGSSNNLSDVIPYLTLYAFAGYKLLPSIQHIYYAFSRLAYTQAALNDLINDIESESLSREIITKDQIGFKESVELRNISFRYASSELNALNNISITINANKTYGIVGPTGSGKTTLVDIILGLLVQTSGSILVDDAELNSMNMKSWQKNIGYVPQDIYLTDDTIFSNIAFGQPSDTIDFKRVREAANLAKLDDFIMNELPKGYDTVVGERGVRLSGGQRQRIGIARALYQDPQIIIFDEATSALDNLTEDALMQSIDGLQSQKTIIIIAHRLSTVRNCSNIFFMKNGTLLDSGTFDELKNKNTEFKEMLKKH